MKGSSVEPVSAKLTKRVIRIGPLRSRIGELLLRFAVDFRFRCFLYSSLHSASPESSKQPEYKSPNLCDKTSEDDCPQRDLLAHREEGVHAPFDQFELLSAGH